jgi:excisionase family DNA binding protein
MLTKAVPVDSVKPDKPTSRRGRAHRYREVAQILSCSERHIIREVQSGRLKATRLGGRVVRIFDDSLDQYLDLVRSEGAA